MKALGLPIKFSEAPGAVTRGAPTFGQHTREVLASIGYAEADIARLIAEGAVSA
jgi:crotonobetainyl-CoA:carnitine CoA-transferase CaiB-like acyl-CoA transferase